MQSRRPFCPLYSAADGGISGGPTPGLHLAKMAGPMAKAQLALDAEQQRLAGTGTTVSKDAYVSDRLAKELPENASDEQRTVLQTRLEAEYQAYDHDGGGLNKHEFRDLMEDRAVAGWDTQLGDAGHTTDLTADQKTAMQTGVTTKGPEVKLKQRELNAWLETPGGQLWAKSPEGQSQLGVESKLKEDGLEGPRTRGVLKAMRQEQVATGAKQVISDLELSTHHSSVEKVGLMADELAHIPAGDPQRAQSEGKLKGQVQYVLDKGGKHDVQALVTQLEAHHLAPQDVIPDHDQRAAILNKLSKQGGSPEQKAEFAASLLRDDLANGKPIDGGGQTNYQWRRAIKDKPSATALANLLTPGELHTLQTTRPEYFKALDQVSGGAATKAVQTKPYFTFEQALAALDALGAQKPGTATAAADKSATANAVTTAAGKAAAAASTANTAAVGTAAYEQGVAKLYEASADGATPDQLAPIAAALVRADLAAGRPIDQGADTAKHEWRSLFNDRPAAEALAKQFTPAELSKLSKQQPEYYKALDLRSGGIAQKRLDQAFEDAYGHRAKALSELTNGGGTPDEKAALAASLVRADVRAGRPIDGGDAATYQWRNLLNDEPSAKALANRFTIKELTALRDNYPEYYEALDSRSHGEAHNRLDADLRRYEMFV